MNESPKPDALDPLLGFVPREGDSEGIPNASTLPVGLGDCGLSPVTCSFGPVPEEGVGC